MFTVQPLRLYNSELSLYPCYSRNLLVQWQHSSKRTIMYITYLHTQPLFHRTSMEGHSGQYTGIYYICSVPHTSWYRCIGPISLYDLPGLSICIHCPAKKPSSFSAFTQYKTAVLFLFCLELPIPLFFCLRRIKHPCNVNLFVTYL